MNKTSEDIIQKMKLDAAITLMEGLQVQGIMLYNTNGKALTKDEFIIVMCKAMEKIL